MKKWFIVIMVLLGMFWVRQVEAAKYLTLTRIGTLITGGASNSTWTYTGPTPDFAGTATPGAIIALTTNAVTATSSAGAAGTWVITPKNLVNGVNSVSIASGNEMISFILSYAVAVAPTPTPTLAPVVATVSAEIKQLPETGNGWLMMGVVTVGVGIFLGGAKLKELILENWEG